MGIFTVPTENGKKVLTMAEYIEREAISEEIRNIITKILRILPMGKGLTVVLIERKEQYSMLPPQMLPRFGMGGGLRHTMNFASAQYANILFMWGGIKQTTAPTAAQRWTEVTAIALWHEQEQMMDIGGMVTIFCSYGRKKNV